MRPELSTIGIVDYGSGNIRAITNVYGRLNIPFRIAHTPADLLGVKKILLPGVGAFDQAMGQLERGGFRPVLDEMVVKQGVPVLGICVGMQIMAHSSDEGKRPGLGWIAGKVRRFDPSRLPQATCLPHMGWNDVKPAGQGGLFAGLETEARFYFLHSYYFDCTQPSTVAATATYGLDFACAVCDKNVYGVQFHPEKSHRWGVQLLTNFAAL
ncbi:MAG: imidazole glycerol phosphate synthase subunit HisH [Lacunisphaera sp.]